MNDYNPYVRTMDAFSKPFDICQGIIGTDSYYGMPKFPPETYSANFVNIQGRAYILVFKVDKFGNVKPANILQGDEAVEIWNKITGGSQNGKSGTQKSRETTAEKQDGDVQSDERSTP